MNSVPWDLESRSDLGWLMQKIWNWRGGTQCEYVFDMVEVITVVQILHSPFGPKSWELYTNNCSAGCLALDYYVMV